MTPIILALSLITGISTTLVIERHEVRYQITHNPKDLPMPDNMDDLMTHDELKSMDEDDKWLFVRYMMRRQMGAKSAATVGEAIEIQRTYEQR